MRRGKSSRLGRACGPCAGNGESSRAATAAELQSYVFADDQGATGDLGVFGATDFATSRIDRGWPARGMRFTSFFARRLLCGRVAHGAGLTGSYPIRGRGARATTKRNSPYACTREESPAAFRAAGGRLRDRHDRQGRYHPARRRGWRSRGSTRCGAASTSGSAWVGANDSGEVHWVHRNEERASRSRRGLDDLTRRYTDEALSFIPAPRGGGRSFSTWPIPCRTSCSGASEPFRAAAPSVGLYGDVIAELDASTGEILDLPPRVADRLGRTSRP